MQKMFMEVPSRYDFMNRVLTFRFDEVWRKKAVKDILSDEPTKILDLCTGTGDFILRIARNGQENTELSGLDYSLPMLNVAKHKLRKFPDVKLIHDDASNMPFENDHFDVVGIAFAFRNLTYRNPDHDIFMKEIFRIIKPGGRFVIVETSQPANPIIKYLFRLYMNTIVQRLGGFLSGNKGAYRYLAKSAINYYNAGEVENMLLSAGFKSVNSRLMMGGIAAIYSAGK